MHKRLLLLMMICFMIGLFTANAQQEEDTFKVWSPIDSITTDYVDTDDGDVLFWELTINGTHTDACEFDLVTEMTVYENNIDIQIYRELGIAVTCLQEDTPFETSVLIDIPVEDIPPYIIVNDQVWEVTMPEGDSVSTDDMPQLQELALFGAVIEDVVVTLVEADEEDEEAVYELELSGSHAVGCEVPLVYSVRELAESTLIGVFNPIPETSVCPAVLRILNETITIPATLLAIDTLVTVNEFIINELETQAMSENNKVMTNINDVTVNVMESQPMQISLDVTGEHPDGCDYPVMVDQERNGNTITLTIYRNVPLDVMCPMMLNPYEATITLDGTFESGSYTIKVNGVTESIDI